MKLALWPGTGVSEWFFLPQGPRVALTLTTSTLTTASEACRGKEPRRQDRVIDEEGAGSRAPREVRKVRTGATRVYPAINAHHRL